MKEGKGKLDHVLSLIFFFLAIFGIWSSLSNYKGLKNRENIIGKIHYRWCSKFNLSLPFSWLNWTIFVGYIIFSLFYIVKAPQNPKNYTPIFFLLIVLSFSPDWQVVVGSKGIAMGRKVVLWEMLKGWEITKKGKFLYLEIEWAYEKDPKKIYKEKLPVPSDARGIIEDVIKGGAR